MINTTINKNIREELMVFVTLNKTCAVSTKLDTVILSGRSGMVLFVTESYIIDAIKSGGWENMSAIYISLENELLVFTTDAGNRFILPFNTTVDSLPTKTLNSVDDVKAVVNSDMLDKHSVISFENALYFRTFHNSRLRVIKVSTGKRVSAIGMNDDTMLTNVYKMVNNAAIFTAISGEDCTIVSKGMSVKTFVKDAIESFKVKGMIVARRFTTVLLYNKKHGYKAIVHPVPVGSELAHNRYNTTFSGITIVDNKVLDHQGFDLGLPVMTTRGYLDFRIEEKLVLIHANQIINYVECGVIKEIVGYAIKDASILSLDPVVVGVKQNSKRIYYFKQA